MHRGERAKVRRPESDHVGIHMNGLRKAEQQKQGRWTLMEWSFAKQNKRELRNEIKVPVTWQLTYSNMNYSYCVKMQNDFNCL